MAAMLIAAAPAAADTRYAEVGGDGPAGSCPTGDPCSLRDAVEDVSVQDGDVVLLDAGTYDLGTDRVEVYDEITIGRKPGVTRPLVQVTDDSVFLLLAAATIQDLELLVDGTASPCSCFAVNQQPPDGGLVRRVIARATGEAEAAFQLRGTTVRNTIAAHDATGSGHSAILSGGLNEPTTNTLRHVTAVAEGNNWGIEADANFGFLNQPQTLNVTNTIASGTTDIVTTLTTPMRQVTVNVSHSNFDSTFDNPPDGVINDLGGNQNQSTDPPQYVSAAGLDFHQLPTSPTIDAGVDDAANGPADFEGDARNADANPDIGADEIELDADDDGVRDGDDNCPNDANPGQADTDGDGQGDACDPSESDADPPELTLSGKKKQSNRNAVVVKASCDEDCTVVVRRKGKATVKLIATDAPAGVAKKSKKKLKLSVARKSLNAGQTKRLKLKFRGKATKKLVKRAIKRRRGKIALKLRGKATDEEGNKGKDIFKVKIK